MSNVARVYRGLLFFPGMGDNQALLLSREQIETCAALMGDEPITPALAAVRFGVSRWAIYKRRRRAELTIGITLPRPRSGRGQRVPYRAA